MSSDEDERPPKQLLQPLSPFRSPPFKLSSSSMAAQDSSTFKKPYQISFSNRDEEIQYTQTLLGNCATYNGDPDELVTWLKETGAYIAKAGYPESDHPFIIRHLLIDDALDVYQAHEDIIFNFYDLRKLFLIKHNALAPLRTLPSLDSLATLTLTSIPSILTSTQLPASTTATEGHPSATTTFTFAQSLDDLTQNDIRKTIIEDLQRNTTKFTGDHRQDVIHWLKNLESKFETAGIPATKKFDLISQLLDKGALDWFRDNKIKFAHSWPDFIDHLKKTFDSPNRARIAMQKLSSYTQSPQQDVRSFCSEMRKLFQEADPQMSSTMKLELLLAKVNPSYRLDLLKQKPHDPEEFETLAKDLENTYLVFDAIEQNSQSYTPFSSATSMFSSWNRQPSTSYNTSANNHYRDYTPSSSNTSFSTNNNYSPRHSASRSSSSTTQRPSRPPFNNRPTGGSYNNRNNPRQQLFAYQPSSSPQQQQPPSSHMIPPLMSTAPPVFPPPQQPTSTSQQSSTLPCQWCFPSGHSAHNCPF
jgi:hypothetical protein